MTPTDSRVIDALAGIDRSLKRIADVLEPLAKAIQDELDEEAR